MRKPIIAGNWKMFKTRDEAINFILQVNDKMPSTVDSVICGQYTVLRCLVKRQLNNLRIGAQNMHFEEEGAYTGEISASMLKSIGVSYVIVGHSERRAMFNETDETVNKKLKQAFKHNLIPILCIGETLEQRENNQTFSILKDQLAKDLKDINEQDIENLVIAYEPIWAIGTGKTATAEMAEEACCYIRSEIANLYSKKISNQIRIQYGGSVKTSNIKELMNMPNIDGALIGGASLKAEDFIVLVNQAI